MIDVGVKMKEFLHEIQNEGLNGVFFPDASFDGDCSEDYAGIRDMYPDLDGEYINWDSLRQDFTDEVKSRFGSDPTLTISLDGFNYLEVYRK